MFIDIAFNPTDSQIERNINQIMSDCKNYMIMPIFIGLDFDSSLKCLSLCEKFNTCCYLGFHPCYINKFEENRSYCCGIDDETSSIHTNNNESTSKYQDTLVHINEQLSNACDSIEKLLNEFDFSNPRVIGIGECGLDYFRSENRLLQQKIFASHLNLDTNMPYFFHCRNSHNDFIKLIKDFNFKNQKNAIRGVVHSFDGTLEEANKILEEGLYIGINGCSLKTKENIEVVKQIPIERILLETDSPYCLIRKSYAASEYSKPIKAKINTPMNVVQIAEILSLLKGISIEEIERIVFENTVTVFPKIRNFVESFCKTPKNL